MGRAEVFGAGGGAEAARPMGVWRRLYQSTAVVYGAIFALAFGVRLIHLYQARGMAFSQCLISDGLAYDQWAHRIAGGQWLGSELFYQAPLYPYFLAVLHVLLGHSLTAIRVVQALLGAGACVLLGRAGERWFSRAAGVVSGVLLALYPPAFFFDTLIQKSVLDGLFTAVLLWLLAGMGQAWRGRTAAAAGVVLGLFCLTRENALALAPLMALWLAVRPEGVTRWRRLRLAGVFVLGAALPLAMVGVRNRIVGGEFHATTFQFGTNFYIGNHAASRGLYRPLRPGRGSPEFERIDATELAEAALGRRLTGSEVSAYWLGEAGRFIREQPGAWLRLTGRKLSFVFNQYEVPDAEDPVFYAETCGLLRGLGGVLHFGVIGPLGAAGMVLTWRRRRELWVLHGMIACIALTTAAFFVFARYRYPMAHVFILFAGAAAPALADAVRGRRWAMGAAALGAAGLAAWGMNVRIFNPMAQAAAWHVNAGSAWDQGGRHAEAVEEYRLALALDPNDADVRENLAIALERLDRMPEAVAAYRAVLAARPDEAAYRERFLRMLNARAERLQARIAAKPDDWAARLDWVATLAEADRRSEAIVAAEAARDAARAAGEGRVAERIEAQLAVLRAEGDE